MNRIAGGLLACVLLAGACSPKFGPSKYEFRGAWVATVKNIDWPSRQGLETRRFLDEFRRIADFYHSLRFNALIVQVRPGADAFYQSALEPWSQWITGKQGQSPDGVDDILPVLIRETHKRNMEFHAWFNPYRAIVEADSTVVDSLHITQTHPEWFVRYGPNTYFNPGIPEAMDHVVKVIADVVNRYDIDAIHFDDYFYPYKIDTLKFPDSLEYALYGQDFETLGDWRRDNVNVLVKALSDTIKAIKPWVKFGISPFGVWRNRKEDVMGSDTDAYTNYDGLYADVLKWQREGWLDYIVPQLYWHIGFEPADYKLLLNWWSRHDYGKHIYVGQAAYRISRWKKKNEMPHHLKMAGQNPDIHGNVFFSAKSLFSNPKNFTRKLRKDYYKYEALIPPMHWIDSIPPQAPEQLTARSDADGIYLQWKSMKEPDISFFVIYRSRGNEPVDISKASFIIAKRRYPTSYFIDPAVRKGVSYNYLITAVDRAGNESDPGTLIKIKCKI